MDITFTISISKSKYINILLQFRKRKYNIFNPYKEKLLKVIKCWGISIREISYIVHCSGFTIAIINIAMLFEGVYYSNLVELLIYVWHIHCSNTYIHLQNLHLWLNVIADLEFVSQFDNRCNKMILKRHSFYYIVLLLKTFLFNKDVNYNYVKLRY